MPQPVAIFLAVAVAVTIGGAFALWLERKGWL